MFCKFAEFLEHKLAKKSDIKGKFLRREPGVGFDGAVGEDEVIPFFMHSIHTRACQLCCRVVYPPSLRVIVRVAHGREGVSLDVSAMCM